MAYRNKTYVAFDGDNDIHYYYLMKAWKQNDNTDFNFYDAHELNTARDSSAEESIKAQLRERMANSKAFVLLLGEHTKNLTKFVKWEVEHAIYLNLPIIVVNLNGKTCTDTDRMPTWLMSYPCISCPFQPRILQYSLENWPKKHAECRQNMDDGHYKWNDSVYRNLQS